MYSKQAENQFSQDFIDTLLQAPLEDLLGKSLAIRRQHFGNIQTYSPKVFVPVTHLCRDVCHYCTFSKSPKAVASPYLPIQTIVHICKQGEARQCYEALLTLGEKPELKYDIARKSLDTMGLSSTIDYVAKAAAAIITETNLIPHVNAGNLSKADIIKLRPFSPSMGIMLESSSDRLCERGMPHFGSPDKIPTERIKTLKNLGELEVPTTTGLLIGIGETKKEILESLFVIQSLHVEYGHIQEVIIQNFKPKQDTKMAKKQEPSSDYLHWAIAVARLILSPDISIQTPPNLNHANLDSLLLSGINDWGGISPVTSDHVNPEAPWPQLQSLSSTTAKNGYHLQKRLSIYPNYIYNMKRWVDSALHTSIIRQVDSTGLPRDNAWYAGNNVQLTPSPETILYRTLSKKSASFDTSENIDKIIHNRLDRPDTEPSQQEIIQLFHARGDDVLSICKAADELNQRYNQNTVTYVINKNINYTNICYFKCKFCAFSKGKVSENLREKPYNLSLNAIQEQVVEAIKLGATEICLQGGIHPQYTGNTYLDIIRAIREVSPSVHIHAFSPLEIHQGASTLQLSLSAYFEKLKIAGLNTLPGTAAEILDDHVRATLCSDKISTQRWLDIMDAAHQQGIKSTATIMFGHIDAPIHWAKHLLHIRQLQSKSGGFTEFVPLPFVHMQSPIYKVGLARRGPTLREALLMHAISRLVLAPLITNIQASWVKMGKIGLQACLHAGCNDAGGTLMNESITSSAGANHGKYLTESTLSSIIRNASKTPMVRSTLYTQINEPSVLHAHLQ